MANTPQNDLRKGKPGGEPNTNAKLAGHEDRVMPMPKSGEHAVPAPAARPVWPMVRSPSRTEAGGPL